MATKKKKPNHIGVVGRRWFDRVNGNTYNSVEIFVDGKKVKTLGIAYGYGTGYLDRAGEWLDANGYVKLERHASGGREPLWRYCKDHKIECDYDALDVPRKKDLAAEAG